MKTTFTKGKILFGLSAWWLAFVVLSINEWNPYWLLYGVGIPFVLLLPGVLTIILLRLTHLDIWVRIVLSAGFSVLEILSISLLGNWILPLFGVVRPLDTVSAVWEISILILILLFFAYKKIQTCTITIPKFYVADTFKNSVFFLVPFVFVALSIFGATRLNNGLDGSIVMVMLFLMAVYSFSVLWHIDSLEKHIVPSALYFMSLALLLMTSLRGWFISGHDIQREFFVFQLAKDAGVWDVSTYIDAYNACLSITILPTIIANVLHVPDMYVYKVLFQIIFALSLIVVYLISRAWVNSRLAFLTGLFFISFPTFFQDMPFLIRQEIAFLFYGLMLYVLFEKNISLHVRKILFFCFGVGVILSHYSTTYTVLFILTATSITTPVLSFLARRFIKSDSAFDSKTFAKGAERKVSIFVTILLLIASVYWTSTITKTDEHVKNVSQSVLSAIQNGFDENARSEDVFVFFTLGRVHHDRTMEEYTKTIVDVERSENPSYYYATSTYTQYSYETLPPLELPMTKFGKLFSYGNFSLGSLVTSFGSVFAKVLQFAIPLGVFYVLFQWKWVRKIDIEYYVLSVISIVFIALCIILPILSKEYGVFRAMQQSMFVLAPFMVLGTLMIGRGFAVVAEKWYGIFGLSRKDIDFRYVRMSAGFFGVLFFLYSTGFMNQLVGGNLPAIHLNNVGDEYSHYIVEDSEMEAILWLEEQLAQESATSTPTLVQADRFGKKKLQSVLKTPVSGNIFPGSILKSAYVFVGPSILRDGVARAAFDGVVLKYTYPIAFLDEQKEVIFENEDVRIYK